MKANFKKIAGAGLTSLALVVGVAGFAGASSGTIGTTGPDSNNEVRNQTSTTVRANNENRVNLAAQTQQHAYTGSAVAVHNTTAGGAQTGNAANTSSVTGNVAVSNTQSALTTANLTNDPTNNSGSIDNTGPDSSNKVTFDSHTYVNLNNDNHLDVHNSVSQCANSGDATVQDNTTGGSAVTGDATNDSTTSFTVSVSN